jgi:four helix bundle protein
MDAPIQPQTLLAYEHGEDIRIRTFRFACRVIAACDDVYNSRQLERLLVAQLIGCSTSTAAMLEEARAAESTRDFISKSSIALKECRESWMRLRIFQARRIGDPEEITPLVNEANEFLIRTS